MKKMFLMAALILASSQSFANECIRVYNEGQAHWMEARKLDDKFIASANIFLKNPQTCEGLVNLMNQNIDAQKEYENGHGRFMTAELDHCPDAKMPGYANSAKLKQSKIRDRLADLQYVYYDMKKEAVRAYCIEDK